MNYKYITLAVSAALALPMSTTASANVNINGFASVAYTDSHNDSGYAHITDGNFTQESLFGIQASFQNENNVSAALQVVARGDEGWDMDVTMAYIGYKFNNDTKVRAGVIRLPLFMLSEYLEVGYAQPWARSPYEVYGLVPIQSITGVDVQHEYALADSYLALQAYGGDQDFEFEGMTGEAKNAWGVSATWYDEVWTLRAGYNTAVINSTSQKTIPDGAGGSVTIDPLNTTHEDASFISLGARYDDGSLLAMTEYTQTRLSNDTISALGKGPTYPENNAMYATLGYRIGQVMPYVSTGYIESTGEEDYHKTSGLEFERTSYSLGARWDITPGLALKADVTYVDYMDYEYSEAESLMHASDLISMAEGDDFIYTIKLDAAF